MTEYHVRQFDGGPTKCDGRNCACASGAMGVAYGTAGAKRPSADAFRARSGVSCVPGVHSPSGGLYISDVERTAATYGVVIDYGRDERGHLRRWTEREQVAKLGAGFGAVLLGDYDQIPPYLDESPGFSGDHSGWVHDFRLRDRSACWHDPLALDPRRVPWNVLARYNHKPGSEVAGLTGFVRIAVRPPDTSTGDDMDSFPIPEEPSVAIVRAGAKLYADSAFKTAKVTVAKATTVRYIGHVGDVHLVGWDQSPSIVGKSALFAKDADVSAVTRAIPEVATR